MNSTIKEAKLNKFASYSRKKAILYSVTFLSLVLILFIITVSIVFLVRWKWNTLVMSFVISVAVLLVFWAVFLGPLLEMLNLSFILMRGLNGDENAWKSKQPYSWLLKFEVNVAIYSFNMINKKELRFNKEERQELFFMFSRFSDDSSATYSEIAKTQADIREKIEELEKKIEKNNNLSTSKDLKCNQFNDENNKDK
ncbi:MAG0130/MAG3770 family membrane protein [Mycoplasmopsis felifaucium]|uniref:Uncharacterized protein n=1 Tax=Mycoplasmopsis felifaucium TaxID=35768 RepID=A0ABZ2RQV8_9BACT